MKKGIYFILFFTLFITGCELYNAEATEEVPKALETSENEGKVKQKEKEDSTVKEQEKKDTVQKEEIKQQVPQESSKQEMEQGKTKKQPVQQVPQGKGKDATGEGKVVPAKKEKQSANLNQGRVYKDAKHKFTLQLPELWKDVKVNYRNEQKEAKASINFTVSIANEEHMIASIVVVDNEALANNYLNSGMFHKLGKVNDVTYVYIRRSEAPDKFYQDKYHKELKKLQQYVNSVPQVMKTFTFIP
ncbi:hypothetical protein [Priestia taiwanensis]|uniref:Lipoprotein n=1 Tax=Priestia taiwanensis TaxID=1347902 RepID=A0A917AWE7_9BACI|nr:hypothetical protein [Priestia taiwanensis]MBM7364911.1 FtsZ-interacting cell division protein ZipA [Priestia taiwanensis]GGE82608.1 hypothetical protein GCM10007140_35290 [Priestia taiwanensis]